MRLIEVIGEELERDLAGLFCRSGHETYGDPYCTSGQRVHWIIENADRPVGFIGVHSIDWHIRRARGTIWVAPDDRRRQIASGAMDLQDEILFDQWNLNRLEWAVRASNAAMLKLSMTRPGVVKEGSLKQAAFFDGTYHDVTLFCVLAGRRREALARRR